MLNKKILFMVMAFIAWLPLQAAEPASPGASSPTAATISPDNTVRFFNRNIVTFNSSRYGVSARDRAHRAAVRLNEQLDLAGPHKVTQKAEADGIMLQINGGTTFWVTPGDASQLTGETVEELAMNSASALERAIAESRESRDLDSIIRALGKSALASVAALMLAWIVSRMLNRLERIISRAVQEHADRLHIAGVKLLHQERGVSLVNKGLAALFRLLMFVLAYKWLSFVLASFPFTRAWGELLDDFLWNLAAGMGLSVANAIPGLFTAIVIFYLTYFFTRSLDNFFNRIRSGQTRVNWLEAEVAEPTRRIAKAVAWLFALAMAYPYLPGSHSDAFRGLSVLVGLMISLGASNLVGQAASGLILIYGRVFRKGEYVRIGEHEGTVTELGMFATRIRTGLGEELTLANSSVLNDTTKNYSRAVKGPGFVLDTTVTIGYDTPWRQVHAMLELAARRTEGVLADPAPLVFQTALSDWYPQYRLVCQAIPSEPRPRALLLSALHGNIQDVFNEHGVQIMSPQYFEDPPTPKVVPQDKWFTAPAIKPTTEREPGMK
jgi:small-conductance mechanosensitive channel